jgi:hypothetical protein
MNEPHPSVAVVLALTVATLACPIPGPYTDVLSPPVAGSLRGSDDTPIAGARVAISLEDLDSTCAHPSQDAVTDAGGAFRFPANAKTYNQVRWVVPLMDRPYPSYRVCVSAGQRLQSAYRTFFVPGSTAKDSLTCVEWAWDGGARATCSSVWKRRQALATGGRWQDDSSTGWYRLILAAGPDQVVRNGLPHFLPHAFVQWVEEGAGYRTVRHIAEVPIDSGIMAIESIELLDRDGVWHANLRGFSPRLIGLSGSPSLMFALGGPKVIRPIEQHGR